ncbi:MAG: DEAD/DEAH box helicase [Bacteroidota bacterium]
MDKKFLFKLSSTPTTTYSDAEVLFRDLKNRDPKIQHLWSHQADILREYHRSIDQIDIALELPTGAGKTLVGLLIAEWRRLSLNQRVAYLCPTRQLAYQVGQKATEYGIKAHVLVGSQSLYPAGQFAEYASAKAIAVTTYSGFFNTNPRIDRPETVVFDDAHAGENYIAKMWSMNISRFDNKTLFDQIVDLFCSELPDYSISTLKDDDARPYQRQLVEMVPVPRFLKKLQPLTDLLDASTADTELAYPWSLIRNKLAACCVFFSWSDILVRPWIPPTLTHLPFASSKQRIYMSATIGAGGELERIIGVPSIHRIPVPQGWDKQSTGRRLFIFPDHSFSYTEYDDWLTRTLDSKERSLVLTPHGLSLRSFLETMAQFGLTHQILKAQDVEETLDPFINSSNVLLALTNRYDGIDLPGDSCRILVVYGLPTAVNLQERFLWTKLGLTTVLKDRIRTRITQAVGRCTRNSTDYAVVLMIGESLFDFCVKHENRSELHPELRAEIDFGIDNSSQSNIGELTALIELFLNRDASWNQAEADISKRRDETLHPPPAYVGVLRTVVHYEVDYQYDLWKEDYSQALVKATTIIDNLSGDELAGYRALWNYFAGCASYQLGLVSGKNEMIQTAADRFLRASQAVRTLSWFARLAHEFGATPTRQSQSQYLTVLATEFINSYLMNLGTVGRRFDKVLSEFESKIRVTDSDSFDQGLTELGKMLGFDAEKPEGVGVPDSVWRIGGEFVLLFESKSDESPDDKISIRTCRQAQGHLNWERSRPFFTQNAKLHCIVVTPRSVLDKAALPHSDNLYYLSSDAIRKLFREADACLRLIRSKSPDLESEQRLGLIQAELLQAQLIPEAIIKHLTSTRLADITCK